MPRRGRHGRFRLCYALTFAVLAFPALAGSGFTGFSGFSALVVLACFPDLLYFRFSTPWKNSLTLRSFAALARSCLLMEHAMRMPMPRYSAARRTIRTALSYSSFGMVTASASLVSKVSRTHGMNGLSLPIRGAYDFGIS